MTPVISGRSQSFAALTECGFPIVIVHNGPEALKNITEFERPGVHILDAPSNLGYMGGVWFSIQSLGLERALYDSGLWISNVDVAAIELSTRQIAVLTGVMNDETIGAVAPSILRQSGGRDVEQIRISLDHQARRRWREHSLFLSQ